MIRRASDEAEEQEEAARATTSLAGLAFALALVVGCLYLVGALRDKARLEDCLMSGRSNCAQVVVQPIASSE